MMLVRTKRDFEYRTYYVGDYSEGQADEEFLCLANYLFI